MLELHYHPLASYCHKALIGLAEHGVEWRPVFTDPGNPEHRARLGALWPPVKFPVLHDPERGEVVAESSVIIEYLDRFHAGGPKLIPDEPDLGWKVRMWDRVLDLHLQRWMQVIVDQKLRPDWAHPPQAEGEARANMRAAYAHLDGALALAPWGMGERFTLVDCAAAPVLLYADLVEPMGEGRLRDWLNRLKERPSFAAVLEAAEPYFNLFPLEPKPSRSPS